MSEKPLRKEVKVDTDTRMGHAQQDFSQKNDVPRKPVGEGNAAGEYKRKKVDVQLPDGYNGGSRENDQDYDD